MMQTKYVHNLNIAHHARRSQMHHLGLRIGRYNLGKQGALGISESFVSFLILTDQPETVNTPFRKLQNNLRLCVEPPPMLRHLGGRGAQSDRI